MAKIAPDAMIDSALDYVAGGDYLCVCSTQPTTYEQANTTYMLAKVAMAGGDFVKADDTSGRELTINRSPIFICIMNYCVLSTRNYFQVFYSIIQWVFVNMVNNFSSKKFSANVFFHYVSMFKNFSFLFAIINNFSSVMNPSLFFFFSKSYVRNGYFLSMLFGHSVSLFRHNFFAPYCKNYNMIFRINKLEVIE